MPRRQPMDSTCSHRTVTSTPVSSMMWWPLNHLSGLGGCRLSPLDYPIYLREMRTPMLPEDYQYHAEKARLRLLTSKPGRGWARASLVCGAWSLFVAPAVLGPLGVAAGCVAIVKGAKWWGAFGVSGSALAAVVGYYWTGGLIT